MKRYLTSIQLVLLLLLIWIALNVGSSKLHGVFNLILGNGDQSEIAIMREIRLPRIIAAIFVGAALGVAGALAQGATRNSLAEPAILGTSSGAAFFTLIAILFNLTTIGTLSAALIATIGALAMTSLTFALGRGGKNGYALVIIGIAVSALTTALVGITAIMINRPDAKGVTFWTLGSLALTTKANAILVGALVTIFIVISVSQSSKLDYLALGDLRAKHFGIDPNKVRWISFILIALLIGTITSAFGAISFLALAVPHIARAIFGVRHRIVVAESALIGALLLLLADTLARTVAAPNELPIGLVTALIGAPVLAIGVYRTLVRSND